MSNNTNNSPKSYKQFLLDRINFLKSGTKHGDSFNLYDSQSHLYFKIFFDFNYNSGDNPAGKRGLLCLPSEPDSETMDMTGEGSYDIKELDRFLNADTAWNYLQLNGERERAYKLIKFVKLLSDISTKSPWYFTSVSGLETALTREQFGNHEFKIEEESKKITIKCLPDAYDNRIGALIDLYRNIVWSHSSKREIVPANLRKFDMSIYIFSDTIGSMHGVTNKDTEELDGDNLRDTTRDTVMPESTSTNIYEVNLDANASIDVGEIDKFNDAQTRYIVGHKYIEFHNCEFNFNSSSSGYGEISNSEGYSPEYTIEISFDNAYEQRYDEIFDMIIGDFMEYDWNMNMHSINPQENIQHWSEKQASILNKNEARLSTRYKPSDKQDSEKFFNKLVTSTINHYAQPVINKYWHKLKSLAMGNMHYGSILNASMDINQGLKTGEFINFVSAKDEISKLVNGPKKNTGQTLTNKKLFEDIPKTTVTNLGNIFKAAGAAKNI